MNDRPQDIFTRRQLEIVRGVASGKLDKEIGNELHVSVRTVKSHLGTIYTKLGFSGMGSRYRLIVWSYRNKLAA